MSKKRNQIGGEQPSSDGNFGSDKSVSVSASVFPNYINNDTTKVQVDLDKAAEDAANKKKDEIKAEIEKLNEDADKEVGQLDEQKKNPGITDKEKEEISIRQQAVRDKLFEGLINYNTILTGENTPLPIKAAIKLFHS